MVLMNNKQLLININSFENFKSLSFDILQRNGIQCLSLSFDILQRNGIQWKLSFVILHYNKKVIISTFKTYTVRKFAVEDN